MTSLMVTCGSIIYINAYIMHHVSTYASGERKVLNTRTHSGGDNETIFIAMKIFVRPIIKKFQVLFALYKISYCVLYPNAWDCNLPVPYSWKNLLETLSKTILCEPCTNKQYMWIIDTSSRLFSLYSKITIAYFCMFLKRT